MKAINIKEEDIVFFNHDPYHIGDEYSYDGNVIRNNKDTQVITVCYLCGYKSFCDDISYEKVFGVLNMKMPWISLNGYSGHIEKVYKED